MSPRARGQNLATSKNSYPAAGGSLGVRLFLLYIGFVFEDRKSVLGIGRIPVAVEALNN